MKHILFVIPYLTTGGTNRSLQCLLSFIDSTQYDVDVFVLAEGGVYQGGFPNSRILPCDGLVDSIIGHYSNKKGLRRIMSGIAKTLCKLTDYKFQEYVFRRASKKLQVAKYDAVVAYSEGVATAFVGHIRHYNKIAWIHCDYASYCGLNRNRDEYGIYKGYKSVVCVSQYTRQSFLKYYPPLDTRTFAIHNLVDDRMMVEKSRENSDITFCHDRINIVSVGRIDPVKRMSAIPEIASRLRARNLDFNWFIIGPTGSAEEYKKLTDNVEKYKCGESVFLLGEKSNPYPYIKKADLLVDPSQSEACPYVINEALLLGTPVVSTDFGSASEFIVDGKNGIISQLDKIHLAILNLVSDKRRFETINRNVSEFRYDNPTLLYKILSLLNG